MLVGDDAARPLGISTNLARPHAACRRPRNDAADAAASVITPGHRAFSTTRAPAFSALAQQDLVKTLPLALECRLPAAPPCRGEVHPPELPLRPGEFRTHLSEVVRAELVEHLEVSPECLPV